MMLAALLLVLWIVILALVAATRPARAEFTALRARISDLERSIEELQRAKGILGSVLDASPVAVVAVDRELRVTTWNRAAEELVGFSRDEATGRHVSELLGDEAGRACKKLASEPSKSPWRGMLLSIARKRGGDVEVCLSLATVEASRAAEGGGAPGVPWGVLVLQPRSCDHAGTGPAFNGAVHDPERDRLRSDLLGITAHELRNPMASIKGILSFMRWRLTEGKPVYDMKKKIEVLEREIDRLARILDEMQEAFRVQEGRLDLECGPVDLGEVLETAVRPFAEAHERRRFLFEGASPHGVTVHGDFRRLEDVFRNLLSNAVKYSPPTTDIVLSVAVTKEQVSVGVMDTGVGIPPEDLPHVFRGFYRGSNLRPRDPGGLGLGLYICKGIVDAHGGSITIESRQGGGTTCRVSLPLQAAGQQSRQSITR